MSAARLSSRPTCWNSTYSGIATAIGGRIRCEISQNAMSLLARAQVDRRPIVWARIANTAAAATSIRTGGPPSSMPMNAIAPLKMNSPISATLGRYVKRTSA